MIIVKAPFRISLGGGGCDLPAYRSQYGAKIVTATINKYMYVFINEPAIPDKYRLHYSQIEAVDKVEDIKHGIIREALKMHEIYNPIEITSMADLAAGTGMGSSSAFTVALLKGLATYTGEFYNQTIVAEDACKIEIDILGAPIGKQDQYAIAFGGFNELNISKDNHVSVDCLTIAPSIIRKLEGRLQMYYTNTQRDANAVLTEQGKRIEEDSSTMRLIHQIGRNIKAALHDGDIDSFGELMSAHWQAKRRMTNSMSNTFIDECYEKAKKNGALGGKIMGAGGGGLLLLCSRPGKEQQLKEVMSKDMRLIDFKFENKGVKVISNV